MMTDAERREDAADRLRARLRSIAACAVNAQAATYANDGPAQVEEQLAAIERDLAIAQQINDDLSAE